MKKEASQKHCKEPQKEIEQHTVWHSIDTKLKIHHKPLHTVETEIFSTDDQLTLNTILTKGLNP